MKVFEELAQPKGPLRQVFRRAHLVDERAKVAAADGNDVARQVSEALARLIAVLRRCEERTRVQREAVGVLVVLTTSSKHVGSIGGLQNFASNLAGIFTPILIGILVDQTGSFVAPLAVIGAVSLIGAVNYLFVMGRIEPLKVKTAA